MNADCKNQPVAEENSLSDHIKMAISDWVKRARIKSYTRHRYA